MNFFKDKNVKVDIYDLVTNKYMQATLVNSKGNHFLFTETDKAI